VAEGAADLYPRCGPTMEWDVAAGDCIWRDTARTGRNPSALSYNTPDSRNASLVIGLLLAPLHPPAIRIGL
jgi:3'(2'), 5'-bisphosphate nucleotidase